MFEYERKHRLSTALWATGVGLCVFLQDEFLFHYGILLSVTLGLAFAVGWTVFSALLRSFTNL
jgi:hypothetical protein